MPPGEPLAPDSGASQLEQSNLRRHEDAQRHSDDADPAADVQLAVSLREMPHDVLRDQPSGRPPDHRQIELAAVDVAREGQRDAARRRAVERSRDRKSTRLNSRHRTYTR